MDDQAIAKKTKTKKGTFESLSLHGRLERFAKKFPEVGQALLAVKWLGNSGTHSSELTASDSLDGFELLSFALDEIFESKSKRLKALTTTIIKKNTRKKRKKPLPAVP